MEVDREGGRGGAGLVDFDEQQPPAPPLVEVEGPSDFLEGFFLSVQQEHPPPAGRRSERKRESEFSVSRIRRGNLLILRNSPLHMHGFRSESTVV